MTSYIKCWVLLVVLAVLVVVEAAPVEPLGHVHATKIRPAPFKKGKREQVDAFPGGRRLGFGDKSALGSREEALQEDGDDTGQSEDTSTSVSTCQLMHYISTPLPSSCKVVKEKFANSIESKASISI